MIKKGLKTLIILPHLDDEFALIPVLECLAKGNSESLRIVFCAERLNQVRSRILIRREENKKALNMLGINRDNISYLNDLFPVNDLELYKQTKSIYSFLDKLYQSFAFEQILTLTFEGGNPDHDALALIVNKFSNKNNIKSFYFPAYNYQKLLFIPFTVLKPLKSQYKLFKKLKFARFCWINLLKLSYIYKSEYLAFLKLLPFLLIKSLFSNKIYCSKKIDIGSVEWDRSLSYKRYFVSKKVLFSEIESLL